MQDCPQHSTNEHKTAPHLAKCKQVQSDSLPTRANAVITRMETGSDLQDEHSNHCQYHLSSALNIAAGTVISTNNQSAKSKQEYPVIATLVALLTLRALPKHNTQR